MSQPIKSTSEERVKHLEFIQSVITRMNTNSFQIKGWTIAISAALLAVYASSKNETFILVGLFPVVVFWFLDSYYLMQERKFRGLYNDVAGVSRNPREVVPFDMRPDLYTGGKYAFYRVFASRTLGWTYLPIALLLVGVYLYLKQGN